LFFRKRIKGLIYGFKGIILRCIKKNWAAVRREERRELPQPVVIVHNIYEVNFQ